LNKNPAHVPTTGQPAPIVEHGTHIIPAAADVGEPTAFGVNPEEQATHTIAVTADPDPML